MKKLSVIIPAYNEEKTIAEIIRKVKNVTIGAIDKEIIVVDNGSRDKTPDILALIEGIKVVTLNPNRRKGGAVKAGFKEATGDMIIIQDADLEYDPEDFPAMIAPVLAGKTEMANGVRIKPPHDVRKKKSLYWLSWFGNNIITWTTNILYWNNAGEYEGCYKVFTKKLTNEINVETNDFDFDNELVCRALKRGYKSIDVPIRYYPRSYAEGKHISWKHGFKILWTIIRIRFTKD